MTPDNKPMHSGRTEPVWLAALWVLILFSNLPIYIGAFVLPLVQPVHWIAGLLFITSMRLIGQRSTFDLPLTFPVVLACYAAICLAWYVGHGGGDPIVLRQRMLGLITCVGSYLVFVSSPSMLLAARKALLTVVVISIFVNFWDISHPYSMVPASSEFATVGRAAGFYVNPNQAGAALVLGFILSVGILPTRWRVGYIILTGAAVTLTWSRAAMLGYTMAVICLAYGRQPVISRKQVLSALLIGAAVAWTTWLTVSAQLEAKFNVDPAILIDRVLWILDPAGRADHSQAERLQLVQRGLDQFFASPLFGNGVGSTELWTERGSTHNMYVMLASDFGVIGFAILPVLILAGMSSLPSRSREASVAALFLLFWGLFSHNVLSESYLLIGIAMMAALARSEGQETDEVTDVVGARVAF